MTTETEVKLARYNQVEKETDAFGRVIGVRRLKPSEQSRLAAMTSDLSGFDEAVDEKTGVKIRVPHRATLVIASAVCLIHDDLGEARIPFPANRRELDAIMDRLDMEGLEAAAAAAGRLADAENSDPNANPKDDAKNL